MTQVMRETLQAASTIAKTAQTQMGNVVRCGGFDFLALYFDYVNGDETGVIITAWVSSEVDGTFIQHQSWTGAAGAKTPTVNSLGPFTANGSYYVVFDVRGLEYIKFTQGGSNNDGTPTGTIAARYSMTK